MFLWRIILSKINASMRMIEDYLSLFSDPNSRDFALETIKTLGIIFTGIGLVFNVLDGRQERKLAQARLVTDSFSKAIEQIGHKEESVQVGGIYALEHLAFNSKEYQDTVLNILSAYVRQNENIKSELNVKNFIKNEEEWKIIEEKNDWLKSVSSPTQASLTVINRLFSLEPKREKNINLSNTNLKQAYFFGTNLLRVNLFLSNLTEANMEEANLQEGYLVGANLTRANLIRANLVEANLIGAYFKESELEGTQLQNALLFNVHIIDSYLFEANLSKADLTGANLRGSNLEKTNLREVNLKTANLKETIGLTPEQVKSACYWQEAKFDVDFREKLEQTPDKIIDCSIWE